MKACILFSTHPIFILHIEVADFEHFILTVGKKFSTESSVLFKIGSFWTQDTEQVASPVVGNNSETQSFTSLKADLHQDINEDFEFIAAGALIEHFLEGNCSIMTLIVIY